MDRTLLNEILAKEDGSLSFGNFMVSDKIKINDFEHIGNIYNLRSHDKVTRLEKNGELLLETVPGAHIENLLLDENNCSFCITSAGNLQLTIGLLPNETYKLAIDGADRGDISTNASGKASFSIDAQNPKKVAIIRNH